MRGYLQNLSEAGLKASTIQRRLSALRQFHGFLYAEGHRADDPTVTLSGPRKAQSLPKVLGVEDIDRLFTAAQAGIADAKTPAARRSALRLSALVEMLYATGLRVSELLALSSASLAPNRDHLVVRGKGGRERIVLLTRTAKAAVFATARLWAIRPAAIGTCFRPRARRGISPGRFSRGNSSASPAGRGFRPTRCRRM